MGYQDILNSPEPELFYISIGSMFVCNILLGIWAQVFSNKDNSWIDVMWGLTFVIPNAVV